MTILHFIHCNRCKKDYLVGVDNKELIRAKTSGGKLGNTPFMAIGNDELDRMPKIGRETNCRICGTCCQVKISREQSKSKIRAGALRGESLNKGGQNGENNKS